MPDVGKKEMNVAREGMNGYHNTHSQSNGVSHLKSPPSQPNGMLNTTKNVLDLDPSERSFEKTDTRLNGVSSFSPARPLSPPHRLDMTQLPLELREMLAQIDDSHYVPLARLFDRAARACWSDLIVLLQDLAKEELRNPLQDPKNIMNRLPGADRDITNDTSDSNRVKKKRLWDYAEDHKRALVKLLVILQWSSKSEDNRLTIALNFYLHQVRSAFFHTNTDLAAWIEYMTSRQDACPDLHTAMDLIATGRVPNLPNLGFVEEKQLTERQMLSTLDRLNTILNLRIITEDHLPRTMSSYHVHDGRVTFNVPQEFDLDLTVKSEESDASFAVVDVRFNFWPMPTMSTDLRREIFFITDNNLATRGLQGAYNFLHELILGQKLEELRKQATGLMQGLWAGQLQVEMFNRILVVQYWLRRPGSKNWIEIAINSGRSRQDPKDGGSPIPFLNLRWMRNGKLVDDHEIEMDMVHLSFQDTLNQVIAQHTNFIFDGIYDKLAATKLYSTQELTLDQSSSVTDAFDCNLAVDISKTESIHLTCDPVSGIVVLSPLTERTNRLQYDLGRSKNIVDDFVARFSALRCSTSQATLMKSITNTSWQALPGRKPTLNQVKDLFGPFALRAAFFRQRQWSADWMLAACFGSTGDLWYLVHEPFVGRPAVQPFKSKAIHLELALTSNYFEDLSRHAAHTIALQTNYQAVNRPGVRTILPAPMALNSSTMRVMLDENESFSTVNRCISLSARSSKRTSCGYVLFVLAQIKAPQALLRKLADARLDSSIAVLPEKRILKLRVECVVGETKMDIILARLHYVDDLISCMNLVGRSGQLKLQSVNLNHIIINYHTAPTVELALRLDLETKPGVNKVELLPQGGNPHSLVADHMQQTFGHGKESLSERLRNLLATLRMTLPLVNCLQYLQGLVNVQDAPEMSTLDLEQSRQWLRIHVICRDMQRFGVHFFANNIPFQHDDKSQDATSGMLARLEIEPLASNNGGKLSWIFRPAVAEFLSYTRQSYSSEELEQRLAANIWTVNNGQKWQGMDKAAKCVYTEPCHLFIAIHDTILDWLKEEVASRDGHDKLPATSQHNMNPLTQSGRPRSQQQQQSQRPGKNVQQGRPANMAQHMSATSRVMTAPPQQVKQPPPTAQRRPGQSIQNRNSNQGRSVPGVHDTVINLD